MDNHSIHTTTSSTSTTAGTVASTQYFAMPTAQLKNYLRFRAAPSPFYMLTNEVRQDLQKIYTIQVTVQLDPETEITTEGSGVSRRIAEMKAARNAIQLIAEHDPTVLENVQPKYGRANKMGRSFSMDFLSKNNRVGSLSSMLSLGFGHHGRVGSLKSGRMIGGKVVCEEDGHFQSASPSMDGIDSYGDSSYGSDPDRSEADGLTPVQVSHSSPLNVELVHSKLQGKEVQNHNHHHHYQNHPVDQHSTICEEDEGEAAAEEEIERQSVVSSSAHSNDDEGVCMQLNSESSQGTPTTNTPTMEKSDSKRELFLNSLLGSSQTNQTGQDPRPPSSSSASSQLPKSSQTLPSTKMNGHLSRSSSLPPASPQNSKQSLLLLLNSLKAIGRRSLRMKKPLTVEKQYTITLSQNGAVDSNNGSRPTSPSSSTSTSSAFSFNSISSSTSASSTSGSFTLEQPPPPTTTSQQSNTLPRTKITSCIIEEDENEDSADSSVIDPYRPIIRVHTQNGLYKRGSNVRETPSAMLLRYCVCLYLPIPHFDIDYDNDPVQVTCRVLICPSKSTEGFKQGHHRMSSLELIEPFRNKEFEGKGSGKLFADARNVAAQAVIVKLKKANIFWEF